MIAADPSNIDYMVLATMKHMPPDITGMALHFGGNNTIAITEIAAKLNGYGSTWAGAAAGIYASRTGNFMAAIRRYQDALIDYWAVKADSAARAIAQEKVVAAFQEMQTGYQAELSAITSRLATRQARMLNSAYKAMKIVRKSGRYARFDVADPIEADRLVRFRKYSKLLGNAAVVISFASRANEVRKSYEAGENGNRELFTQSLGLGATSAISAIAEGVGVFLITLTPVGWVGLVVGLGVAAVAAGVSVYANNKIQQEGGAWYDEIMEWLN
jgi:uncharacterized protein YukE